MVFACVYLVCGVLVFVGYFCLYACYCGIMPRVCHDCYVHNNNNNNEETALSVSAAAHGTSKEKRGAFSKYFRCQLVRFFSLLLNVCVLAWLLAG